MKFRGPDGEYALEFKRDYRRIQIDSGTPGVTIEVQSKYPYTTAIVRKVTDSRNSEEWPILAQASVGCANEDKFYLETGRCLALKKLTKQDIGSDMKGQLWKVYKARMEGSNRLLTPKQLRKKLARMERENADLKKSLEASTKALKVAFEERDSWHDRYKKLLNET